MMFLAFVVMLGYFILIIQAGSFVLQIEKLKRENRKLKKEVAYWKLQFGNVMAPKGEHDGNTNIF